MKYTVSLKENHIFRRLYRKGNTAADSRLQDPYLKREKVSYNRDKNPDGGCQESYSLYRSTWSAITADQIYNFQRDQDLEPERNADSFMEFKEGAVCKSAVR